MSGAVLVVGSLRADLIAQVAGLPAMGEDVVATSWVTLAGGTAGNQGVAAASAGAQVVVAAAVGDDAHGAAYRARLAARHIDIDAIVVNPGPSDLSVVTRTASGDALTVVVPAARHALTAPREAMSSLTAGDVVLLSLDVPSSVVADTVALGRELDLQVLLNVAPLHDIEPETVTLADVVITTESEALALADAGLLPQSLLVDMGVHGASWDGVSVVGPTAQAPLDESGAHDVLCGVLAAKLAAGADREGALASALTAAARCRERVGPQSEPEL